MVLSRLPLEEPKRVMVQPETCRPAGLPRCKDADIVPRSGDDHTVKSSVLSDLPRRSRAVSTTAVRATSLMGLLNARAETRRAVTVTAPCPAPTSRSGH